MLLSPASILLRVHIIEEPMEKDQKPERFHKIAPLPLLLRIGIATEALRFFSTGNYVEKCKIIEKEDCDPKIIRPFSSDEFMKYLNVTGILPKPRQYLDRIRDLLESMEKEGILTLQGFCSNPSMPKYYYFQLELSSAQLQGSAWLSPALGGDCLFYMINRHLIHLTGENDSGDQHGGTGIAVGKNHILTCAHVVDGMTLHEKQKMGKREFTVTDAKSHPSIDVGIVTVREELRAAEGFAFYEPTVGERVYIFGYPKIPMAKEATLTIQHGEVTSEPIETISGQTLFLFSAFARPGNSGGPVINQRGQIVGIVSDNLTTDDSRHDAHFAGVPSQEIIEAVSEIDGDVRLLIEDYQ